MPIKPFNERGELGEIDERPDPYYRQPKIVTRTMPFELDGESYSVSLYGTEARIYHERYCNYYAVCAYLDYLRQPSPRSFVTAELHREAEKRILHALHSDDRPVLFVTVDRGIWLARLETEREPTAVSSSSDRTAYQIVEMVTPRWRGHRVRFVNPEKFHPHTVH